MDRNFDKTRQNSPLIKNISNYESHPPKSYFPKNLTDYSFQMIGKILIQKFKDAELAFCESYLKEVSKQ